MCLSTVDKKTKKFLYGWKVFSIRNKKLIGQFETKRGYKTKGYPIGEWINDVKTGEIEYSWKKYYKKGFHFYKYKIDGENNVWLPREVLKKVKMRNIIASGIQLGRVVGVAKEMYIMEEI